MPGDRTRRSFTPQHKAIILHLYDTFEGGEFKKLLADRSYDKNIQKANRWSQFTEAYKKVRHWFVDFHRIDITSRT